MTMNTRFSAVVLLVIAISTATLSLCDGFATPVPLGHTSTLSLPQTTTTSTRLNGETLESEPASSSDSDDNPYGLPEIQGDFDWDSKFAGDPDWITEDVPGKIVMNEIDLAAQVTALNKMEEAYKKQRLQKEYEESKTVGWVSNAELLNGRTAMFFLATGLLTELWTGVSMPGQVEEMLRIGGFIGFD
jgi:Chlorophyll A-B binding protein